MYIETSIENFRIRQTKREDCPLILSLIKEIAKYEKMLDEVVGTVEELEKSIFDNQNARVHILEFEGREIGYVIYFFNYSTFNCAPGLYLEDIYIRSEYRHNGFGREIFKILGKIAKENNCKRMEWACLNWNEPSIKFYTSLGAVAMNDWTVYRLTEDKIDNMINSKKSIDTKNMEV